jgi:hypothetical protein
LRLTQDHHGSSAWSDSSRAVLPFKRDECAWRVLDLQFAAGDAHHPGETLHLAAWRLDIW